MEELKKILEKEEYEFYGIRMDDAEYAVGDTCANSHQWWQDDPEDDEMEYEPSMGCWDGGELDGTCAFEVSASNLVKVITSAKKHFGYYSKMYLIGGDSAESGNDAGEIVISGAKVLHCA